MTGARAQLGSDPGPSRPVPSPLPPTSSRSAGGRVDLARLLWKKGEVEEEAVHGDGRQGEAASDSGKRRGRRRGEG